MKKFKLIALLVGMLSLTAHAELPDLSKVRVLGNQLAPGGQAGQIGSWIVDHKIHTVKASYSVLRDGGNFGSTYALKGVDNKAAVLPAGAILKGGVIDIIQPPNTLGSVAGATLSLQVQSAQDVMDVRSTASMTGVSGGILPAKFASVLPLKLTAKRNVSVVVGGTQNLSYGKFNVLIEYYLSDTQ